MFDSMADTGWLQEEDYVCQKIRSTLKKKKKRPVTRTQEPAEVLHESIWVMDTIRELFLSRSHLNTRVIEKNYFLTFP